MAHLSDSSTSRSSTMTRKDRAAPRSASRAYAEERRNQHVSSELKQIDPSMKLPSILVSTASEFWQQNVAPGRGAGRRRRVRGSRAADRIVARRSTSRPIRSIRLIVDELTHQFQFDHHPDRADTAATCRCGCSRGCRTQMTGDRRAARHHDGARRRGHRTSRPKMSEMDRTTAGSAISCA